MVKSKNWIERILEIKNEKEGEKSPSKDTNEKSNSN